MKLLPCLFAILSTLGASFAGEASKPNIILILSDDQGFMDYGFMGHKTVKTPNIDRMASESLLYTRGYVMPVCSPSLACLLTGKLPHEHGITGNDLEKSAIPTGVKSNSRDPLAHQLLSNSLTLPKSITEAGYLTFQSGKLWNTTFNEVGFTEGMTDSEGRHGGAGLAIGRKGMQPVFMFMDSAKAREKPFFLWYAPMMPHQPHDPPQEFLAHYQGKGLTPAAEKYYAMVEWFDQTCGDLDEYLAKNDLKDNTVIIYLADNGWSANTGPGPRAKLSPYEMGIRTPMFVRWPGKVKPLRDDETLASILDIAPSILKIAGAKTPGDLPGIDLLDREAMTARKSITVENFTHNIKDLGHPEKSLVTRVVIGGWSKLLIPGTVRPDQKYTTAPKEIELFDLKSDPLEKTNIAIQKPDEVKRLQAIQDRIWKP